MTLLENPKLRVDAYRWVHGQYPEPNLIPAERYTSREFLELEYEKLWPYVWQFACRQEEVANVGDYVEYTIGNRSVLIVRSAPNTIKGFHNACLHRGRSLKEGCGSARELRCGYHSWRWNLDGTIKEVVDPETFHPDAIRAEDLCLPEVKLDCWGGFVFINFDLDAEPLTNFIAGVPKFFDPYGIADMHVSSVRTLVIDGNWKVALEAFVEAYHVMGTHQQMLAYFDDSTFKDPNSCLISGRHATVGGGGQEYGARPEELVEAAARQRDARREYSPRLMPDLEVDPAWSLVENLKGNWDTRGLMWANEDMDHAKAVAEEINRGELPEGTTPWARLYEKIVDDWRSSRVKIPERMQAPDFMVFPNFCTPACPRTMWVLRSRPYGMDPAKCLFDLYYLRRFPEGEKPTVLREFHDPCITGDDPRDVDEFGLVLYQDLRNIPFIQKGLNSLTTGGVRPGMIQERAVRHLHEHIDAYLLADR